GDGGPGRNNRLVEFVDRTDQMIERARRHEFAYAGPIGVELVEPATGRIDCEEMSAQDVRQSRRLRCGIAASAPRLHEVRPDGFGDRPDPARSRVMGAVDANRIDDQSGLVEAEAVGMGIERVDEWLRRTTAGLLVTAYQPNPFVVMTRSPQLARRALGRGEIGGEVFAQDAVVGTKEA